MSSVKLELSQVRGRTGIKEVNEHVQGAATLPEYTVGDDMVFSSLMDKRDEAITAMLETEAPREARATASYLASAYRDARYAAAGRKFMQALGYGNMIRGHYEAAKQARDNGLE